MKIEMRKTVFVKHPRKETTYTTDSVETKEIVEDLYWLMISDEIVHDLSTIGISQTNRYRHTDYGYMVYMITLHSKSDIKETKIVKEFKFILDN